MEHPVSANVVTTVIKVNRSGCFEAIVGREYESETPAAGTARKESDSWLENCERTSTALESVSLR